MRRSRRGRGRLFGGRRNPLFGAVGSLLVLVLVAGAVVGWARSNNIRSVDSAIAYFKAQSSNMDRCVDVAARTGKVPGDCTKDFKVKLPQPSGKSGVNLPKAPDGKVSVSRVNVGALSSELGSLRVAEPNRGVKYSRSEWKHWVGSPCNTRKKVLIAQGYDVKYDKSTCKITSGYWIDPYSGVKITNQKDIDIDHVSPLQSTAQRGGQAWSPAKKQQFANDTRFLLATSAKENRAKGASTPADYMPPNKSFHCEYAKIYIDASKAYSLTISARDKQVLTQALKTCR